MWTSWSGQHDALKGKTPQQGSGPDKWTDNGLTKSLSPSLISPTTVYTETSQEENMVYPQKRGEKGRKKERKKKEQINQKDFFTSLSHFVTYTPNHRWLNSPRLNTGSHQLKPFVNKHSKFRTLILTEEKIALVEKQLTNFINVNTIICEASAAVRTCQKNLFTNHYDRNYWNEETYPTYPEESHVNQTPAFLSPRLVNWGHLTRGAPQVGWPRLQ